MPDWIVAMAMGALVIYGLLLWALIARKHRNKEEK